jgi:Zn-dependent oligopeptidase
VARARNRNRAKGTWKEAAASALRDADLVRDMLASEAQPGAPEEVTRVAAVRDNVERVATRFDGLASSAPTDNMRRSSTSVASSLRGYFFALEAEQLLHGAPTTPTADQLAAADATKRTRAGDLEAAVADIRAYVSPGAAV